jgi:hypothetical protein
VKNAILRLTAKSFFDAIFRLNSRRFSRLRRDSCFRRLPSVGEQEQLRAHKATKVAARHPRWHV